MPVVLLHRLTCLGSTPMLKDSASRPQPQLYVYTHRGVDSSVQALATSDCFQKRPFARGLLMSCNITLNMLPDSAFVSDSGLHLGHAVRSSPPANLECSPQRHRLPAGS